MARYIGLIVLVFLTVGIFAQKCPDANSHRADGADPSCQINCNDLDTPDQGTRKICNEMLYHNQCYCNEGFVILKQGNDKCVKRHECPCADANSERKEHGSEPSCQLTCDDVKAGLTEERKPCVMILVHNKCYCKKGFVLEKEGGTKCVEKSKC